MEGLPQPFRDHARAVAVQVIDWPPDDVLRDLGIDDPLDLTGLYDGTPLPLKSAADPSPYPDIVWLYRAPILDELQDRPGVSLRDLVAHVVIHEFAHHFGWSDDDIAAVDRWWE
ncbi:metallopeptidase family protein [Tateyamaria sp. SN6-1]|uniref:metallopeptidase family protein n=1 Tax=Tateyamaria sp. SN6-1 TaxID=3092148 RepID=UPI0039F521DF